MASGQWAEIIQLPRERHSAEDLHSFKFTGDEGDITVRYRISSTPLDGPNVRVRVQFEELEVHDDEEVGSGDWRLQTSVNNLNCANSPEDHKSIGSGSSADLSAFRTVTVSPNSTLTVKCRVWEDDS
jgi:hypothetical protein